jgi:hypothetical protein
MSDPAASERALHNQFIAFIRAFGLHRPEETPCANQSQSRRRTR